MPDAQGHHGRWRDFQRLWQGTPAPDLADVVAHYWCADRDLRGQPPYRQLLPPSLHPHLTMVVGEPARPPTSTAIRTH